MREKYYLSKSAKKNELLIQEYAVLNEVPRRKNLPKIIEENFSLLCEQTYDAKKVAASIRQGRQSLIAQLRNRHLFPVTFQMDKIAAAVMELFAARGDQIAELIFDDKDLLAEEREEAEIIEEIEEETETVTEEIDNLLKDDIKINEAVAPVKLSDDDNLEYDKENPA